MILSSNYLQMAMDYLEEQISEQLRKSCKDEEAFLRMKHLFDAISQKNKKNEEQLKLLEQVIREDYDSIMITDLNLDEGPVILYVNDGFTKMTGYEKEEVTGKTPEILQGPKTDRKVLDRMKERLRKGLSFCGHTVNYKKDGSEFINQWDVHPLFNDHGDLTNWVAYQRDVSTRKESGMVTLDNHLEYDKLPKANPHLYIDLDRSGNIRDTNLAFKKLTGYDLGELKGRKIWELVSEENRDEVEYLFSDYDQNSVADKSYQWEFVTKKGEVNLLEGSISSFSSNTETLVRIHFYNLTMRNKVIETLQQKKKQIENLLTRQDEFSMRFERKENGEIECKYISESVENITGFNPDLLMEKGIYEALSEEDISEAKQALNQAFNGEAITIRCRYRTTDGHEIPALQSFRPDNGNNSQVESVKSVVMVEYP